MSMIGNIVAPSALAMLLMLSVPVHAADITLVTKQCTEGIMHFQPSPGGMSNDW